LNAQNAVAFRDLKGTTRWLKVALAGLALASLSLGLSSWLQIRLLNEAQTGRVITQEAAATDDAREQLVAVIYLATYVVTAILFLRWTYLSKRNAVALAARALSFTPAWSVGYYSIPLANLWIRYRALKEAFQGSHPEFQQDLEWISPPRLLPLWWTPWLISCFVNQGILRFSINAKTVDQLLAVSRAQLLSLLIDSCLIAVVWRLVSTLQNWQTARNARGGIEAPVVLA
jgi:hypothetical protein